jgi:hypothetical protein
MAPPATLTGQDVGEAEGALSALLDQVLEGTDAGIDPADLATAHRVLVEVTERAHRLRGRP